MSTKDKLDVLDLVISTLKEYEKSQQDILDRLEKLEDKFDTLLNKNLRALEAVARALRNSGDAAYSARGGLI